jgi:lysophospholipase L1-like esterase
MVLRRPVPSPLVLVRRLLLALLVLGLLATGCDYQGAGPRIGLTGDSVMDNAKARIRAKLVVDHRITMLTVPAGHIWDLQGIVRLQVRDRPAAMVIQVGSPDVEFAAESPYGAAVSSEMRKMMDATRGVPCVIWVTLKERGVTPYYTPRWQQAATGLNDFADALAANRPWVHVVDWATLGLNRPDWFLADGLHLTELGRAALATHIDTAVRSC